MSLFRGETMGEYMHIINLDKKEFIAIVPFKFWEQIANHFIPIVLYILLTEPTPDDRRGLGWGDIHKLEGAIGRWAGDRIIILGDYNPKMDFDDDNVYVVIDRRRYKLKDVTCEVIPPILEYLKTEDLEGLAEALNDSYEIHCKRRP